MKGITYAHTFNNAKKYNLTLCDIDEYGVPEFVGTRENFALFNLAEADATLL